MKRIFVLALATISIASAYAQTLQPQSFNFGTPTDAAGMTSAGLAIDSSYRFDLVSFGSFTPTASNTSLWALNVTATLGSASWQLSSLDPSFGSAQAVGSVSDNSILGQSLFIWGYNTKTIGSGTEWLLVGSNSWNVPSLSSGPIPPQALSMFTSSATATPYLGLIGEAIGPAALVGDVQFAAVTAVPEPATYAAILGFVTLGLVGYRRFRRR